MVEEYGNDEILPVLDEDEIGDVVEMLPVNRLTTYEECSREYETALSPHIDQARVWSRIDKLFSGVPPFNPEKLRELGQTHVVNTDFGDARSRLQKAISSYYNIFYKNKFLANIKVEFTKALAEKFNLEELGAIDSFTADKWSEILTEEWTRSKREDWNDEFLNFLCGHLRQLMSYGVNHIFFPDRENPIPESGSIYSHYSPMDAYVDPNKNDVHIVKHTYTLFELLRYYTTDRTKKWNKEALGSVIYQELLQTDAHSGSDDDTTDQVTYIERTVEKVKNHETISNEFNNYKVEVATLYVKEFAVDGKPEGVSRIIFTPHITVSSPIFFDDRVFKTMSEAVIISTLLPGYMEIHGTKGFGHISFGHLHELTKMKCNFATNIKMDGTTFFGTESGSLGDIRKVTVPVSGISVLPDNMKVIHTNTNMASNNILAGVQYLENDLDKNSLFVMNPASSDNAPVGTMQQRAKESVEMQQNNLAHYSATTLDKLYRMIFRKELEFQNKKNRGAVFAKRFIDRCVRRGIPAQVFEFSGVDEVTGLPDWFNMTAYKGTGTGSQVGDSLKIREAYEFGIPQKLKSRGGQYFKELEAAAVFGQEAVDKLYPESDVSDDPTTQATMASLVANQLEQGMQVIFSPDLDHEVYATVLLERMQQVADRYAQQPPTNQTEFKQQEREFLYQTDIALQSLGHFLALNLTYLAEDPAKRPLFNNMLPLFNRLEGMSQGIHANAEKARDAQAREQAEEQAQNNAALQKVIFEHERGKLDIQLKHLRESFDMKGSFNLKLIQTQNESKLATIRAIADARAKILKAQGDTKNVDNTGTTG